MLRFPTRPQHDWAKPAARFSIHRITLKGCFKQICTDRRRVKEAVMARSPVAEDRIGCFLTVGPVMDITIRRTAKH